VFLSYPGIEPGHRIPVIRAATIVFSKAMRFFETQYLDLLARSDYPRKLLLLLRDNFWCRFALCRYSDPSKFPPEFLYVYIIYIHTYIHVYICPYMCPNNILYLRHKVSYQCIARVWTTRSFLVRETLQATLDLFGASVTWISDGKVSLRLRLALRQRHRRSAYRVQGRNVAVDLAAKRPR